LPDKHWQLPSASFIAPLLASTQIFRAVPSCLHKILPAVLHGWMASDRLQGLQRGPASRDISFNIIRKNCILGYFYINIIKGTNYKLYIIFSYYNILHDMISCHKQLERIYY